MNTLQNMINKYPAGKLSDQKNAMKEVIQELALYGLSRAGFFSEAAFYGGTYLLADVLAMYFFIIWIVFPKILIFRWILLIQILIFVIFSRF